MHDEGVDRKWLGQTVTVTDKINTGVTASMVHGWMQLVTSDGFEHFNINAAANPASCCMYSLQIDETTY